MIGRTVLAATIVLSTLVFAGGVESGSQGWSIVPGVPDTASGRSPGQQAGTSDRVGDPPARVRIPAIRVDSPLEELTLDSAGALRAPVDFDRAGWYAGGTAPGDVGPAVIAGHVDSRNGPAVFFRLYQIRPDDLIQVQRGDRWLTFRVVSIARYPKTRFPTADVYGPTPDAQLRLITCGGSFDKARRSYVDNVVVYAVAVE